MSHRLRVALALTSTAFCARVSQPEPDLAAIKAAIRVDYRKDANLQDVVEFDSIGVERQFFPCIRERPKRPATCRKGVTDRVMRIQVLTATDSSASGFALTYTPHLEPLEFTATEVNYAVTKVEGKWTAKAVAVKSTEGFIESR
jgi:hypothetical protein